MDQTYSATTATQARTLGKSPLRETLHDIERRLSDAEQIADSIASTLFADAAVRPVGEAPRDRPPQPAEATLASINQRMTSLCSTLSRIQTGLVG